MQTLATPHPWSELRVPIDRRAWPGAGVLLGIMAALALTAGGVSVLVLPLLAAQLAFFRDPARRIPSGEGVLAPADGVVADVSAVTEERYLKAPAVRIGIFLSVFDCHVTRAPIGGAVRYLQYQRGAFLNALRREAAERNESNRIGVEDGRRRVLIRSGNGMRFHFVHSPKIKLLTRNVDDAGSVWRDGNNVTARPSELLVFGQDERESRHFRRKRGGETPNRGRESPAQYGAGENERRSPPPRAGRGFSRRLPFHAARVLQNGFDLNTKVAHILPALLEIFFQTPADQVAYARVQVRRKVGEIGVARQNPRQHFRHGLAFKGLPAAEQFIEDASERKNVAALVDLNRAFGLFRRHVGGRPQDDAGVRGGHADPSLPAPEAPSGQEILLQIL